MDKHGEKVCCFIFSKVKRGVILKRWYLCVIVLAVTASICTAAYIYGRRSTLSLKKVDIMASKDNSTISPIIEEGTFTGNISYEYAQDKKIYYTKYSDKKSIQVYDIPSGKSETIMDALQPGNKINFFTISNDCYIWEEDNDDESEDMTNWGLYIKKGSQIIKIDGDTAAENKGIAMSPQGMSASGDYLVYRIHDVIPGVDKQGYLIKLYDIKNDGAKTIFTQADNSDIGISDPYINGNYVVWSVSKDINDEKNQKSDVYIYSIKSGGFVKLTEDDNLSNPIIWETYVICLSNDIDGSSIVILNTVTGKKKTIAKSDYTKFPEKEVHDYFAGNGYITWNNSYLDSVTVYDILKDKIYDLKKSQNTSDANNNLINIKLFGKTLLYTDHFLTPKTGKTISETNRYIILR